MNYLQRKKLAFMSIVNKVKGFVREVSGIPPLLLENCVDSDSLIDWKLYGNSVQDGTPTPENSVPVVSVGEYDIETGKYKVPVVARGKNLFDKNAEKYSVSVSTDTITSKSNYYTIFINVENVSDFTLTSKSNSNMYYGLCDSIEVGSVVYEHTYFSIYAKRTITNNTHKYVGITVYHSNISDFGGVLLETGTTATDYEPYHAPITTNLYLDEPLRKVGDYADYVDFKNQKVVRKVFYTSLTEVFNKNINGTQYATGLCRMQTNLLPAANYNIAPLSKSMKGYSSIKVEANSITLMDRYKNIYCYFSSDAVGLEAVTETTSNKTISTAIKQYIQDNEIDIYYVLAEETHTPISIPKLPTIKGTTIYEIGTSLNASNMEATYYSTVKGE